MHIDLQLISQNSMPSYFKQLPTSAPRGVQKTHAPLHGHIQKTFFYGLKKATQSYLNCIVPRNWCAVAPPPPPPPVSCVFDANDCIWYYGTVYVRESVAVEKMQMQMQMQMQQEQPQEQSQEQPQEHPQEQPQEHPQEQPQEQHQEQHQPSEQYIDAADYDDDTESTTSGNGNGSGTCKFSRNIGKQNQLKYLKDGMRLRHAVSANRAAHEWNEWFATFDAETNRIIRTPDGVAFDTLRQFARLHSNEILSVDVASTNVWSDPNFQYQDDASGNWHPLSDLKKCN